MLALVHHIALLRRFFLQASSKKLCIAGFEPGSLVELRAALPMALLWSLASPGPKAPIAKPSFEAQGALLLLSRREATGVGPVVGLECLLCVRTVQYIRSAQ